MLFFLNDIWAPNPPPQKGQVDKQVQ